jgi:hypothetical protein
MTLISILKKRVKVQKLIKVGGNPYFDLLYKILYEFGFLN